MAAPVKPDDFKALIVGGDDTLAEGLIKTFVRLPVLLWKLFSYMFSASGGLGEQFAKDICDLGCSEDQT